LVNIRLPGSLRLTVYRVDNHSLEAKKQESEQAYEPVKADTWDYLHFIAI